MAALPCLGELQRLSQTQVHAAWPAGLSSISPPGWICAEQLHVRMDLEEMERDLGMGHEENILGAPCLFSFPLRESVRSLFRKHLLPCLWSATWWQFFTFKKKKIGIQQYLFKVYLVIRIIKNRVNCCITNEKKCRLCDGLALGWVYIGTVRAGHALLM